MTHSRDNNTSGSPIPSRPSAFDLQAHLFSSLLQGHTADVSLVVRGSWEAVYRLHRVVLIQAGFFRSLFQSSGFAETRRSFHDNQEIHIVFDDPNITRPAFEICIARLYGGGPPLHVDPNLIPTLAYPLTPLYSRSAAEVPTPAEHHPASPRLLLSLIATSVYISVPAVASQALSIVLNTVGPTTVIRYLDFACGKGIGPAEAGEPEAAVGLETLAQPIPDTFSQSGLSTGAVTPAISVSMPNEIEVDSFAKAFENQGPKKEDPERSSSGARSERLFDYGNISNKVGEAATCWLARWVADTVALERGTNGAVAGETSPDPAGLRPSLRGTETQIWSVGGLSTQWVCAVLASDYVFVQGEKERYNLAKEIFELRHGQSSLNQEDKREWSQLFNHGIYYANMVMEDLMVIADEVSPSTGNAYVSLATLQSAHWDQSILKQCITTRSSTSTSSPASTSPPPPRDKDLAITLTTNADRKLGAAHHVYRVPSDSSSRIGSSVVEASSMDQLFENSPNFKERKTATLVTSEATCFGLAPDVSTGDKLSDSNTAARWSPYPPLRFGVEFWDVDALEEKDRLHSQTVWYAGSLYNVYVQVVRKKGVQLGVYLHRQSTVEPIPSTSIPRFMAPATFQRIHSRGPSLPVQLHYASTSAPSISRPRTPVRIQGSLPLAMASSIAVSPSEGTKVGSSLAKAPAGSPTQAYRDSRPAVSAYFTIACHSATGSALTRFTSAPDVFTIGQSWGWKSSSRTEEYFDSSDDVRKITDQVEQKRVSLRATVVLGVV